MARHPNRNLRPPPPRPPRINPNTRQVLLLHRRLDHRRFANPDHNFIDGDNSYSLELPRLPRFAYLLTGSKGEGPQLKRLLQAAYHPRNHYLLHLDLEASDAERLDLAKYVKSESVMHAFRNAMVVGAADLVTAKGPTVMAATLHAVAILLKRAVSKG